MSQRYYKLKARLEREREQGIAPHPMDLVELSRAKPLDEPQPDLYEFGNAFAACRATREDLDRRFADVQQREADEWARTPGYDLWTVERLREEAFVRDLPHYGKPADVIARLRADDARRRRA